MENTLGKRIAANRKRLGMTQEQLAEKLGITAQAVSKWENDQSCPDISVLPLLADIFHTTTDELLGCSQSPDSTTAKSSNRDSHAQEVIYEAEPENTAGIVIKKSFPLLSVAVLMLTVGILFLLSKVLDWNHSFWDILWPCSLLIFGIFGLISDFSLFWLGCTGLGAFFLTYNLLPLPVELDSGIIWAAIIILCGLMLLLDAFRKRRFQKYHVCHKNPSHEYTTAQNSLRCSSSFGEQRQLVSMELLNGGTISNSFGEYTVDLSGVEAVAENCTIRATCSFGQLNLLVPKKYAAMPTSSTTFANLCIEGDPDEDPVGQIQIKASISFGELKVTYV